MTSISVSVIVTIYNIEKYITECINSIINQSYSDFEIILVNNASTDNSMKIATDLVVKHFPQERYQFINNLKNMGCVFSRNVGLSSARGEYIIYVDSDDIVSPNYVEDMVNAIKSGSFDSCICETVFFPEDSKAQFESIKFSYHEQKYNHKADILRISGYPTAIVYRKSVIEKHNLRFEEVPYMEDAIFNTDFLLHVDKIGYCESAKYYMRQRKGSLSRTGIRERNAINNLICAYAFDRKFMSDKYSDHMDQIIFARRFVRNCYFGELKENGFNKHTKYQQLAAQTSEPIEAHILRIAIINSNLSLKDKTREYLMSFPFIEKLIYRIML